MACKGGIIMAGHVYNEYLRLYWVFLQGRILQCIVGLPSSVIDPEIHDPYHNNIMV